ncbi:NUDIX domain-containing protein [uncultured Clostridium sp.]|uniref:NUDIX domain-containing protein n=1 Tax=uncultured Clostridium sp. TaxID=59620 RepID=UPI0028EFF822|nr:NUDIX domain-containing protein [uncultured Clostridium sp.]
MKIGQDYIGVGVGAVISNDNGEILLLLRERSPEAGYWSIPGGKVEFFDTIEDSIKREIKEELGVEIDIIKLLGVTNHILVEEKSHWVAPTFLVEIIKGKVKNMEPNKHKDIKWFSIDNLPDNITLTTKKAIEYLIK